MKEYLYSIYMKRTVRGVEVEHPVMVVAADYAAGRAEALRIRPDLFERGWRVSRVVIEAERDR